MVDLIKLSGGCLFYPGIPPRRSTPHPRGWNGNRDHDARGRSCCCTHGDAVSQSRWSRSSIPPARVTASWPAVRHRRERRPTSMHGWPAWLRANRSRHDRGSGGASRPRRADLMAPLSSARPTLAGRCPSDCRRRRRTGATRSGQDGSGSSRMTQLVGTCLTGRTVATGGLDPSGLQIEVLLDRGFDLFTARFRGVPLSWMGPPGLRPRTLYEPGGFGWLRTFHGGLLVTCGLDHFGGPTRRPTPEHAPPDQRLVDFGEHGRVSHEAAALVRCEVARRSRAWGAPGRGLTQWRCTASSCNCAAASSWGSTSRPSDHRRGHQPGARCQHRSPCSTTSTSSLGRTGQHRGHGRPQPS
jgi:hypothetical protein